MINTTGSSVDHNVSVGDLYTWISTGTSSAMVTNHGTFGVLSDTDTSEPDYGRVLIYHSFLKLQGQWVTTPTEADRVAGDEAEGISRECKGRRHRRLRYIKPPQGRVTAGPRTRQQASWACTLLCGKEEAVGGGQWTQEVRVVTLDDHNITHRASVTGKTESYRFGCDLLHL